MKKSDLAFMIAGFALVVSLGAIVFTKKKTAALEDQVLALKAENGVLKNRIDEGEAKLMDALATRLDTLRGDLGLAPDAPQVPSASAFGDTLLARVGKPARSGGGIRVKVPGDVMRAVLDNVSSLAAEVSISPVAKDKKPDGFSLFEVREGGLALALGFEQGDVIHAVNGLPFRTSEEVVAVYDKVGSAKQVAFEITRDGKPMKLVIEVD